MPQFEDLSSERLRRMLEDRVPENLHLDYKDKRSLLNKKKGDDISKAVSAFLNSDGGDLIYGVPEDKDETGTPIPRSNKEQVIGFEKNEANKEQIEHLITHNVNPRPGPDLFRIEEIIYDQRQVFVVQVLVGTGQAWQAKDKRYYKRFNYKTEPMEHYEIEDTRRRSVGLNINLLFGVNEAFDQRKYYDKSQNQPCLIHIGLQNASAEVVESFLIEIWTRDSHDSLRYVNSFQRFGTSQIRHQHPDIIPVTPELPCFQLRWNASNHRLKDNYTPIFELVEPFQVAAFPVKVPCNLFCRIQVPRMKAKGYVVRIAEPPFDELKLLTFESIIEAKR